MRKLDEWIQITLDQLFISNKIIIHIDLAKLSIDKINIDFTAFLNLFFIIQYSVDSFNKQLLEKFVPSGESYYIVFASTLPKKGKGIHF